MRIYVWFIAVVLVAAWLGIGWASGGAWLGRMHARYPSTFAPNVGDYVFVAVLTGLGPISWIPIGIYLMTYPADE